MGSEQHTRPPASRPIKPILKPPPPAAKTGMFSSLFSVVSRELESFVESVRGVEQASSSPAKESSHYKIPPRSSENGWRSLVRRTTGQPKPKPYARPSPKKDIGHPKQRKVPGAGIAGGRRSKGTGEGGEGEEEEEGDTELEDQGDGDPDGDGDQARHVRFAPNTHSPVARRPIRTSLKHAANATHQDTPGPGKKSGKKAKQKSGLLGKDVSNKDKGKSKASAEQIAIWEKEMEERAWGKVGGSSTIASLEEELLGAKARLKAEKERFLAEGGELSDEDSEEDAESGRDDSYEVVLHPRPPRGTPFIRSSQESQVQSLPDPDESMRRYRRRTTPIDDTPVPKKRGPRTRASGLSLGRAPPPVPPTVVEEPAPVESEPLRPASPPPVPIDSVLMDISPQKPPPKASPARSHTSRSQSHPPSPTRPRPRQEPARESPEPEQPESRSTSPSEPEIHTEPEVAPVPPAQPPLSPKAASPPICARRPTTKIPKDAEITIISDDSDEDNDSEVVNDEEPPEEPRTQEPPPLSHKRRIKELEAEVVRLREELQARHRHLHHPLRPPPPPPPMANRPTMPIMVARRRPENGEFDDEQDEDGDGPRTDLDRALCMMRAGLKATTQTPAPAAKISSGKTPTIPLESMTAFLEEMKTVKLKSRVGPTPKSSAIKVKVEEDDDDDVGNNTFAFRRPRGPPISPRALRATNSTSSNGSASGTLGFAVKLRKTESGATLFGDKPKRTPSTTSVNNATPFPLPGAKRKRPEAEPQSVLQSAVRRRINGSGSTSLDATTEREVPTPSLCSDTTELEVEERALHTPPVESSKHAAALPEKSTARSVEKKSGASTEKPSASTTNKSEVQAKSGRDVLSSGKKATPNKSEKPASKSKAATSQLKIPNPRQRTTVLVRQETRVFRFQKIRVFPSEIKRPRYLERRVSGQQQVRDGDSYLCLLSRLHPRLPLQPHPLQLLHLLQLKPAPAQPTLRPRQPRPRKVEIGYQCCYKHSFPQKRPSGPYAFFSSPSTDFSAKKPRPPRLFTPQRREVIVVDDSDEEESAKSANSRRSVGSRQRKGPNDSDSDDPLAFTSTPAPGSKNSRSSKPEWDLDSGIMNDLSFRSLFPNSDDEELESDVYTGTGTQSKTAGFLKGGGSGGRAVWAGAGTVTGADEPAEKSASVSSRRR
ncbi:hypothetical protein RHS01_07120 [Rhizoctonia solani]|uniref:Uncharacterized protein n=1 Tax=Rhizoctonia solani TaxID=456999 RepID=A0A8H7I9U2_9AGAM|nr:hypothetical protein RHS01_07120 [Rhizoctonia solani]